MSLEVSSFFVAFLNQHFQTAVTVMELHVFYNSMLECEHFHLRQIYASAAKLIAQWSAYI